MSKDSGYLLPTNLTPANTRCITLEIPDDENHIRAFLGQLDMLSYWWTWKRDPLKQGTTAARRWQQVVQSARQQLGENTGCENMFDVRVVGCLFQKTLDGVNWTTVADLSECAGTDGADGADGADGSPVELRTYFGTIQWRVQGTEVWNHLLNLSEITGADGADGADGSPVELRTYFGTIQWRVQGTAVWNHLVNLADVCDCKDEPPVNPNDLTDGLLCAIGFRVAAEIRKYWDAAFELEPTLVSSLASGVESIASFAGTFYQPYSVPASKVSAVAGLIKWLDRTFQQVETNAFTTATEYFLAGVIYCELSRRQQREIGDMVTIDIAPHVWNSPDLTERQKMALVGLILSAPADVWQWSAHAAAPYPDGTACAGADCDEPAEPWCVSLLGIDPQTPSGSAYLLAANPLAERIVMPQRGRLGDIAPVGYEATGGFGYPFLPDSPEPYPHRELRISVQFPRMTQLSRLEFLSNYNQTASTAEGTRLKVTTNDGLVLIHETVTGVESGASVEDIWWGDVVTDGLIIEAELWSDMAGGGFATVKILDFYIQGDEYNPFGSALTNCDWLVKPVDDVPEHDWSVTFDFTQSNYGFNVSTGSYLAGVGFVAGFHKFYQYEWITIDASRNFSPVYGGVVAIELHHNFVNITNPLAQVRIGNFDGQVQFPTNTHGMIAVLRNAPNIASNYIQIELRSAYVEDDSLTGNEVGSVCRLLRLYGTGSRPAAFAGIPD